MRTVTFACLLLAFSLQCLSQAIPDSVLRQMLTRAVYSWQEGRARDAFFTLDSVIAQPITDENAGSKVKAALWTSNYLMEQKKVRPAKAFIDSALAWSQLFPMEEESMRVYQALSQWHAATGDAESAVQYKDLEWAFRDSISRLEAKAEIDSLKEIIARSESQGTRTDEDASEADNTSGSGIESASKGSFWPVILLVVFLSAVVIYLFRIRKTTRSAVVHTSSPASTSSTQERNLDRPSGKSIPVMQFQSSPDPSVAAEEKNAEVAEATPLPNRETLLRLQGVELVLIRPEVLAAYQNGDLKAIRNLLNEYMAQLPFIMKTLDEAINRNETAPILISLQHVKSYLKLFGMQATGKLIGEVEAESSTEKVSKLLSRVFQVRNHCRRAADEAKSLLEKIG